MQIFYWWLTILLIGIAFFPLVNKIFNSFRDGGWIFSKTIGLLFSAWILFICNSLHILPFTRKNAILVVLICGIVNYVILIITEIQKNKKQKKKYNILLTIPDLFQSIPSKIFIIEEIIFLIIYLLAIYIIGFKPEAQGVEKFMDYGFMSSMMRSLWMPPKDIWYAPETINYYYGGQYIATFITKMTNATVGIGYNLMRSIIVSFSFILPFSIVYQFIYDRFLHNQEKDIINSNSSSISSNKNIKTQRTKRNNILAVLPALLSGLYVAFGSNTHFIFYYIIPYIKRIFTGETFKYIFSNSTRYIGHNPVTNDKCIHEFPAYANLLGDLHAHYINILFVIVVLACAYAWARKTEPDMIPIQELQKKDSWKNNIIQSFKMVFSFSKTNPYRHFLSVEVFVIGIMTGIFRWTNYWDFPIYYVICGAIFFFVLLRKYWHHIFIFIWNILAIAGMMFVTGLIAAMPFTSTFNMIASEIKFTYSHTPFYQLFVLWGFSGIYFIIFSIYFFLKWKENRKNKNNSNNTEILLPDYTMFFIGLCAIGLIILPEVIYVKDIYSNGGYRANTMFKLTYQSFIILGMFVPYVCAILITNARNRRNKKWKRAFNAIFGCVGIVIIIICCEYTPHVIWTRYGNIFNYSKRIHSDASVFVSENFRSDLGAINYLNTHIAGQPTILEAHGNSYSSYERISATTGLPTIIGWRTHELLWRNQSQDIWSRIQDVKKIYTSDDYDELLELIQKYDISYIYVGKIEKKKYPEINEKLLRSVGNIIYKDDENETYILDVKWVLDTKL